MLSENDASKQSYEGDLYEDRINEGDIADDPNALLQKRKSQNTDAVAAVIATRIEELSRSSADVDPRDVLARELPELLDKAQFDSSAYRPRHAGKQGYGKDLLFHFDDGQTPFCLQVFSFDEGQVTPIHDHPCECASLVWQGEIIENSYDALGADAQAIKLSEHRRSAGSHEQLLPTERNIHSLRNEARQRAITIHLYNMDGVVQTAAVKDVFNQAPAKPFLAELTEQS